MEPDLAHEFARRYGTPFYAYDRDAVQSNVGTLRACLPGGSHLHYSLKANPLPALVREARAAGCSAEVTSLGELAAAREAGCTGSELLAGGPAKTSAFLDAE
ncbi:MAG TPA: hypothetical protein VD994_06995 [Prosthecobacter sp.]|nr:hypothetical protein [Prosthecobacter sp.]